jgi:hypothetical protein
MNDTAERLIAAWLAWDHKPSAPGAVAERLAAIEAAGLPALETQVQVARNRSQGMSIPDAVQAVINDREGAA